MNDPTTKDAFDLSLEAILDFCTENWPDFDLQNMINLAVVIDNIYQGFDENGNKR